MQTRDDIRISVCPRCDRYGAIDQETEVCALRMVGGQLRTCKPSRQWVFFIGGPYNAETLDVRALIPLMILPYETNDTIHSARYRYRTPLVYEFVGSDE